MFKVELIQNKQTALILTNSFGKVYKLLVEILKQKGIEVFTGKVKLVKFSEFDYIFFINPTIQQIKESFSQLDSALIIFTYESESLKKVISFLKHIKKKNIKVAGVSPFQVEAHLERALWFFFSGSSEIYLPLELSKKKKQSKSFVFLDVIKDWFSFRKMLFLGTLGFIIFNLLIWLLLITSFISILPSITKQRINNIKAAEKFYKISFRLYRPIKPIYHFFLVGSFTDNLFNIGNTSLDLIRKGENLSQELPEFFSLALKPQLTIQEFTKQKELLKKLKADFKYLNEEVEFLINSLPQFTVFKKTKVKIKEVQEFISLGQDFLDIYEKLFPQGEEKEYIVFFVNNMELRPGGGFIGSFAIIRTRPLGVNTTRFYDVYDADGQLKFHIEPPEAISKYLKQPHWFLRDSNFSPDMKENYLIAKKFLKYEMPEHKISGVIIITTTAVREILRAYKEVYLPDYKEKITADNFYIKTQFYSQNDFFPGSLNKKRFLQTLLDQLIIEFERVDPVIFFRAIKKGLDQKYIVAYFEDKSLQNFFDKNYWSGRIIIPKCYAKNIKSNNCIVDYVFPVDANLGVNKANFYIRKSLAFKVKITSSGEIVSYLEYIWKNDSPSEVFPGGKYKNYFRLFLLGDVEPNYFEYEDRKLKGFDLKFYNFSSYESKIGFTDQFILVPAGQQRRIVFSWKNSKKLKKGSNLYQLILQKQIGSVNFDFSFEIILPKNVYLVSQNFKPLVKKGKLLYNTYLSNDKIFFLELIKE